MSDGDGISNRPGPASAAEPSMEEILASIRRILSEEESGGKRQAASDELVLRASMRVLSPELPASATEPPRTPDPVISPEEPSLPQPGHFAQAPSFEPPPAPEPAPITIHVEPEPVPTPVWQQTPFPPADEPAPPAYYQQPAAPAYPQEPAAPFHDAAPAQPAYPPPHEPIYQSPQPPSIFSARPASETLFPMQAEPSYFDPQPSQKDETMDEQFQGPEGLVGDQAVSDISNSIGALVRSVSAERAAGVGRAGVTIEDIVREEMKPVLKAWLDTHLPSLVERMVRAEINRVIEQAQR